MHKRKDARKPEVCAAEKKEMQAIEGGCRLLLAGDRSDEGEEGKAAVGCELLPADSPAARCPFLVPPAAAARVSRRQTNAAVHGDWGEKNNKAE